MRLFLLLLLHLLLPAQSGPYPDGAFLVIDRLHVAAERACAT